MSYLRKMVLSLVAASVGMLAFVDRVSADSINLKLGTPFYSVDSYYYDVILSAAGEIRGGVDNRVILFDFNSTIQSSDVSFIPDGSLPAGWSSAVSVENLSTGFYVPSALLIDDNAGQKNIRVELTAANSVFLSGAATLGQIRIQTAQLPKTQFVGRNVYSLDYTNRDGGLVDPTAMHTYSSVAVPIPLPAAAWAGLALMGALGLGKLRSRKA